MRLGQSSQQDRIDAANKSYHVEVPHVDASTLANTPTCMGMSSFTNEEVRHICRNQVPGWDGLPEDALIVDQLCGGLSNHIFKAHVKPEVAAAAGGAPSCVLFRAYGKDSSALYDRALERRIFSMLSAYQIGPQMYASGEGWRIEEWHMSVPLPNRSMRNPSNLIQVASHLGRLHKLSGRPDFPKDLLDKQPLSRTRLVTWGEHCLRAAESFVHPENLCKVAALQLDEMTAETRWLVDYCLADDSRIDGAGLDVVFSHWDMQENNILQTNYGLRYIDFEYSGMEHQAFDIASYFVECTIDYLHPKAPFFKVSPADFPLEWEQRLFCSVYLSEYLETAVRPDDLAVTVLLGRVRRFTLMNHLLWAMWSVIRAPQAPSSSSFDYLEYARTRWLQYKWTKHQSLHSAAQKQPRLIDLCGSVRDEAPVLSLSEPMWPTVVSASVAQASRSGDPSPS